MKRNASSISAILSYKNKILLICPDIVSIHSNISPWGFISGLKEKKDTHKEAVNKKIFYTTNLKVYTELIITEDIPYQNEAFYYFGKLTDQDVNKIERREGQRLEFFTLQEMDDIQLTTQTANFLQAYRDKIETLLI